eukprot:1310562-Pyramimonas_sp.AAC.1
MLCQHSNTVMNDDSNVEYEQTSPPFSARPSPRWHLRHFGPGSLPDTPQKLPGGPGHSPDGHETPTTSKT